MSLACSKTFPCQTCFPLSIFNASVVVSNWEFIALICNVEPFTPGVVGLFVYSSQKSSKYLSAGTLYRSKCSSFSQFGGRWIALFCNNPQRPIPFSSNQLLRVHFILLHGLNINSCKQLLTPRIYPFELDQSRS